MENAFDLLEEKVRKAAELVKRLRDEKKELEQQAARAHARLEEAEKKLGAVDHERASVAKRGRELESAQREVETLRHEREEVRTRIARLVDLLEGLD